MHATIFGQISPEFPFVTLGAQTETGYIFNEAVSGGHSCSSSTTTTTLCCRLVTISAWSWWSEKKNNQMSRFPERKPSDECFCPFAYAARCHTPSFVSSACPMCCLRHVQHAIFPNTPPPIETPWMWRIFADCLFLSNRPEMMKQFSTELTSVGTFQRGVAHCDFHAYPLLPIKYSLSRSNYSLVFEAIIFCLLPWGWNRQITQSSFFFFLPLFLWCEF